MTKANGAPSRWWQGFRAVVAYALSVVAALAARTKLDDALADMHPPGQGWGSYATISGPSPLWAPLPAAQSISGWRAWEQAEIGLAHGIRVMPVLVSSAVVDLLLLSVPLALLIRIAARVTAARYPATDRPAVAGEPDTEPASRRGSDSSTHTDLGALAKVAARIQWPLMIVGAVLVRSVLLVWASEVDSGTASMLLRASGALTAIAYISIAVPALLIVYVHVVGELGLRERSADPAAASHSLRRIGRVIVALRMQILAAAVFPAVFLALGSDLTEQVDDLALRWPATPWTLVAAVVAAFVLSVLLLATGYLCWSWYNVRPARTPTELPGWIPLAIGIVLIAGYAASYAQPAPWSVLLWPGLVFLAIGLVSVIEKARDNVTAAIDLGIDDTRRARQATHVCAGVPFAVLGYIAIRAGVQVLILRATFASVGTLFLVGAVVALALSWLIVIVPPRDAARAPLAYMAVGGGLACLALGVLCAVYPIRIGQSVGALAILYGFSGVLLAVLVLVVYVVKGRRPSLPIALLRIRRIPVLSFLVLWLVVTSAVQGTDHYHDARLLPETSAAPRPVTVATAVSQWLDSRGAATPIDAQTRTPVPMVFVATLGGGGRAAYWTNLVLDCLYDHAAEPAGVGRACNGPQLDESSVFAESGVSGGSVGLAVHRALGSKPFASALSGDFVSPDIAAMVFRDAEAFWIPTPLKASGHDRAAVLEEAWERATGGALAKGMFADAWQTPDSLRFPLMLFNSATVDDGCRLDVSVLQAATTDEQTTTSGCTTLAPFAPTTDADVGSTEPGVVAHGDPVFAATKDLYDYVCTSGGHDGGTGDTGGVPNRHDMALSTAALLSARFPYISPTGGLTGCAAPQRRTFAMDGGVLDNSGTSALSEIWSSAAGQIADYDNDPSRSTCVEPRLLIIDNGYADPGPVSVPSQPQELVAPLDGALAVRDQQTSRAEQAAALEFQHAFGSVVCRGSASTLARPVATRVALVEPSVRPGPYAPVGWSLSTYATDDLAEQLDSGPNQCELAVVRSWYTSADPFSTGGACVGLQMTSSAGPVTFH